MLTELRLLNNIDVAGLNTIDVYERLGGYRALRKALGEMTEDEVLTDLESSGLRGRGGAGFAMGKKASFIPKGRHDVYVCTNISCSLCGADELYDAMLSAAGDDPDFNVQSFECLGACDIAPMASVNSAYVGPLSLDDCPALIRQLRDGEEPLPDKQLARRPCVDPKAATS